jgi:glycosyltransferase involved in cell wall biosynthesis
VAPVILDVYLHRDSLLNVVRQFAELGHNTSLVCIRSRNVTRAGNSRVRVISVPLRYVPIVSPLMFATVLFLFLPIYTIKLNPDFIIIHPDVSILSSLPGILISGIKKMRFVLDVRSTPVETVGFRGFLQRFWFNVSILIAKEFFRGITVITPLMKREICNSFQINQDKVGVWTSGVSVTLFNPKNYISQSKRLKRRLNLSGKFIVFYHGIFTPSRGLIETIEAIKILRDKYPNVVFFLLGAGPMTPVLKELIRKEQLEENVSIHDSVDQMEVPKFIEMCDICIVPLPYHPYWRFQSPLKLLEYLAMEKVTIATDIPAHRLIIGNEKCGIYVSSVNPIEIARSIEYAYLNKERLGEWGKSGRTIVNKEYTWEKVAKDLENYLLSI